MKVTTKVTGARQARVNVGRLVEKLERGAMRKGMAKAANLMAAKVRKLAPVQSGLLKKSIRSKIKTDVKTQTVYVLIGPSNKISGQVDRTGTGNIETVRPAKYAHLVEFGTQHSSPKPFMRPAFEAAKGEAVNVFKKEMMDAIPKVAASLLKRRQVAAQKRNLKK